MSTFLRYDEYSKNYLPSHSIMHLDQVAVDLEKKACSIALKMKKRPKVYILICHDMPWNEQSVCIESVISSDNSTERERRTTWCEILRKSEKSPEIHARTDAYWKNRQRPHLNWCALTQVRVLRQPYISYWEHLTYRKWNDHLPYLQNTNRKTAVFF